MPAPSSFNSTSNQDDQSRKNDELSLDRSEQHSQKFMMKKKQQLEPINESHLETSEGGMGLIEHAKNMNELKNENYDLRMQVFNLKKEIRKVRGSDKASTSFGSDHNMFIESKVFEPKSELLDNHKRMHDYNEESSDNDEISISDKITSDLIETYQAEIQELKTKAQTTALESDQLQNQLVYYKNEFDRLKPLEEIPASIKKALKISDGQSLSIGELQSIIEQKVAFSTDSAGIVDLTCKMMNYFSPDVQSIEAKNDLEKLIADADTLINKTDEPSNFGEFKHALENIVVKINEIEERHQKSLTQYPIENLNADVTEVEGPSVLSKDLPISTPMVSKRVNELRHNYLNFSSDMFKSVSNLKDELSLMCSTEYGSRLSSNFPVNVSNLNATSDGTVGNMFEKSDMQYANINTLLIRLEQLVSQNNSMQNDLVEKLDEYQKMEAKLSQLNLEMESKDLIIKSSNENNQSLKTQIVELEEIAAKIQNVLGCTREEIVETIGKLEETIEALNAELGKKHRKNIEFEGLIGELQASISNLENDNANLISELEEVRQHAVAPEEISAAPAIISNNFLDTSQKPHNIELAHTVDFKEWQKKYEEIKKLTKPVFENCALMQQALENKMMTISLTSHENKQHSQEPSEQISAGIQTSAVKFESIKGSTLNESNKSLLVHQENISQLKNHICLLESEIKDANDQIEALKIHNSIPESQKNDSKLFDLVDQLNNLKLLLEKSYENNRSLRSYLNSVFSSSTQTPSLASNDGTKNLKFFTAEDISTTERSIQDCLALLRNMSKLVKSVEMLPIYQSDKEETQALKQNIYKSKKIMKVMHKSMLNMYRTIINSEQVTNEKLVCNDLTGTPLTTEQISKISEVPSTELGSSRESLGEKNERGKKIKEMVYVFENLQQSAKRIDKITDTVKNKI